MGYPCNNTYDIENRWPVTWMDYVYPARRGNLAREPKGNRIISRAESATLNSFPALVFTCLQYKSFEKTVGKGEIARNEHFLLFLQYFLPIWRTFCHFYQT